MTLLEILALFAIPSTITGVMVGWLKYYLDKKEKKREEREHNVEQLMLLTLQESRATNVLAAATAKAVQRIPDAHCNGDMTEALERASKIQKEEKEFLMEHGIRHIFES